MANGIPALKQILYVSLTKQLSGNPLASVLEREWSAKASPSTRAKFNPVGFDLNPKDPENMQQLRQTLDSQAWDGILIAWCTRGQTERTELFEEVVDICVDETTRVEKGKRAKLIFNTGPTNLVEPTLRNFPVV